VFRSCYIFTSRCIFASSPYWFSSKELFIKSSNGVGKEKKLYAKKWYKKELVSLQEICSHVTVYIGH
jgi:hypothetical protein